MDQSTRRIRVRSIWLSAAVLTLFLLSAGIFAEHHIRAGAHQADAHGGYCKSGSSGRPGTLIRIH